MTIVEAVVAIFPPVFVLFLPHLYLAERGSERRKSATISVENERVSVMWRGGNGSAWK
jgi:hypothetical protein